MPQLNPNPWFMILIFSWLMFLTIIPYKISNHMFMNELESTNPNNLKLENWNWPWH